MMLTNVIFGFLVLWLLIITLILLRTRGHYKRLISRTKKRSIDEILDSLTERGEFFSREIDKIQKTMEQIVLQGKTHFQKIGFVRFNPFERVGGEQSFVISLLDREDSGIILNFLYTREGVRVYAKQVEKGSGVKYELSSEEKEAIKKAE